MCDQCNHINCAYYDSDYEVINLTNTSTHIMNGMHSPCHLMSEERESQEFDTGLGSYSLQNIQFSSNFVSINNDLNTSTSTHFSDTDLMSNQRDSSCESTVNLNLKRKGINIVF